MPAVDEFLTGLDQAHRAEFERLRTLVVSELEDHGQPVVEFTSYGLPTIGIAEGSRKAVVGFAAGKRFLSWYPFSGRTITALADELARVETTKGSVHFTLDAPLPDALVRALVRTRLDEVLGR